MEQCQRLLMYREFIDNINASPLLNDDAKQSYVMHYEAKINKMRRSFQKYMDKRRKLHELETIQENDEDEENRLERVQRRGFVDFD